MHVLACGPDLSNNQNYYLSKMMQLIPQPVINGIKYQIPEPKLSTEERQRRRLMFRNERHLYKRNCDLCSKNMISAYSPDKPYTVYCSDCFWSDKWDPCTYGREFDFNKTFAEQFYELNSRVPLLSNVISNSQNCEYNSFCTESKDCYLNTRVANSEGLMHSYLAINALDCVDCFDIFDSKYCYECIDCWNCYNCKFSQLCRNCSDCSFCFDCIGCTDCFGSVGLCNAKYYFFNQQLTKEEYEAKMKSINLGSHQTILQIKKEFEARLQAAPMRNLYIVNAENVTGNYITSAKNIFNCFDVEKVDTAANSWGIEHSENIFDCAYIYLGSNCYEHISNSRSSNIFFSFNAIECNDLFYSMMCYNNSHDCFGSISMKKKSYCILNKQYTREEYFALVPKIIEHMRKTGEWGEFFPAKLAHFAYNESVAQDYFPLTQEQALAQWLKWQTETEDDLHFEKSVTGNQLPDAIQDVTDTILDTPIICAESGKPFRVARAELDFYRRQQLALPRLHPNVRHALRLNSRQGKVLYQRPCGSCGKLTDTCFPPADTKKVYCVACYQNVTFH